MSTLAVPYRTQYAARVRLAGMQLESLTELIREQTQEGRTSVASYRRRYDAELLADAIDELRSRGTEPRTVECPAESALIEARAKGLLDELTYRSAPRASAPVNRECVVLLGLGKPLLVLAAFLGERDVAHLLTFDQCAGSYLVIWTTSDAVLPALV